MSASAPSCESGHSSKGAALVDVGAIPEASGGAAGSAVPPAPSVLLSSSFVVVAVIILGKITAYARDAILSRYYGASSDTDALFVASNVPNLVFSAFFASITIVFLPVYNRIRLERGAIAAEDFCSNAITVYVMVALCLSGVCLLFASPIVTFMAPAFTPSTHELATNLTRIVCASFAFTSVSGILSSVQYASNRYLGPLLIPTINNLITAGAVVFFASKLGIYVAAVAATLAWVVQIPIQARRIGHTFNYRPRLNLNDEALRQMSRMFVPVLLSVSMDQVYVLTDNILGSSLSSGSISALNYSQRLLNVATGTFVLAITTVMFPLFSQYVIERKYTKLYAAMDRCLSAIVLVMAPVMVLVAVVSHDIVAVAFRRGAFDEAATTLTAVLFSWYAIGVMFGAMRDTLNRVHYALHDTRTPLVLSAAAMAVKVLFSVLLVRRMGAAGLALATSTATAAYCIAQFGVFRRRIGSDFHHQLIKTVGQVAIAAVAMMAIVLISRALLPSYSILVRLIVATALGVGVYVLVLLQMKVTDVNLALRTVAQLFRRAPRAVH